MAQRLTMEFGKVQSVIVTQRGLGADRRERRATFAWIRAKLLLGARVYH